MSAKKSKKLWCAVLLFITLAGACKNHHHPQAPALPANPESPDYYQAKYQEIMEKMHRNMDQVEPDEDDQITFLRQMIPHHEGAVEMSELIIQSAKDRRVVNLARGIITEQRNEIMVMNYLIDQLSKEKKARYQ